MLNLDIIFYSHSPWSGVSSSLFILYRWFYAWYILVNRVCHILFFLGRITNLALYTCSIISYTSFPMINCYSLIIASFIAFFSSSWVISCTHVGLHPSRWIYHFLKIFLPSWCLWPWELQIHVYWSESWIVITCSSEQVSSFFSCRRLFVTFPTIQMYQFHG